MSWMEGTGEMDMWWGLYAEYLGLISSEKITDVDFLPAMSYMPNSDSDMD